MSKEVIEQKLAELMDLVPECEGLIAADLDGKVLIGQTITEMDHSKIAKACAAIFKEGNNLSGSTNKGSLKNTTLELENGFAVVVGSSKSIFIALAGVDGKASLALLKRHLISISNL